MNTKLTLLVPVLALLLLSTSLVGATPAWKCSLSDNSENEAVKPGAVFVWHFYWNDNVWYENYLEIVVNKPHGNPDNFVAAIITLPPTSKRPRP